MLVAVLSNYMVDIDWLMSGKFDILVIRLFFYKLAYVLPIF